MRIRDRLRRVWRWATALLAAPSPASHVSPPVSLSPTFPKPPPPKTGQEPRPLGAGDPVILGDVTLRLWPVGDLVVLATSEAEAEWALVALLGHPDQDVRGAAGTRLDALRDTRAAAA
jgi:hypothetical protein